jgi:hypothetical protein
MNRPYGSQRVLQQAEKRADKSGKGKHRLANGGEPITGETDTSKELFYMWRIYILMMPSINRCAG